MKDHRVLRFVSTLKISTIEQILIFRHQFAIRIVPNNHYSPYYGCLDITDTIYLVSRLAAANKEAVVKAESFKAPSHTPSK